MYFIVLSLLNVRTHDIEAATGMAWPSLVLASRHGLERRLQVFQQPPHRRRVPVRILAIARPLAHLREQRRLPQIEVPVDRILQVGRWRLDLAQLRKRTMGGPYERQTSRGWEEVRASDEPTAQLVPGNWQ